MKLHKKTLYSSLFLGILALSLPYQTSARKKMVIKITEKNFEKEVLKHKQLTIVKFWAPWCAPCLDFAPLVERIAKKYKGRLIIGGLHIDENPIIYKKYNVKTIPTLIFFKDGEEVERIVGRLPEDELSRRIEKHLN